MTVRARLYDARGEDREIDPEEIDPAKVADRQLLWIDIDERSSESLGLVANRLDLPPEIVRQLGADRGRPRLVRVPSRVAVTIVTVEANADGTLVQRDLDLVAAKNLVVTVHDGNLRAIDELDKDLLHEQEIGRLDAGALLTALVDSVIVRYLDEVEAVEREIDRLDTLALRSDGDSDEFLNAVVVLRRRIALLRRSLTPNRNALGPLVRPDFQVHGDILEPWPDILERLERAIDSIENSRESLVGSFDIYLGRSAQRTNEVMKVLTLVSAILLPSVVLAGIMGMNFKLEFFDNTMNFVLVVGTMIAFALVLIVAARWKRWI